MCTAVQVVYQSVHRAPATASVKSESGASRPAGSTDTAAPRRMSGCVPLAVTTPLVVGNGTCAIRRASGHRRTVVYKTVAVATAPLEPVSVLRSALTRAAAATAPSEQICVFGPAAGVRPPANRADAPVVMFHGPYHHWPKSHELSRLLNAFESSCVSAASVRSTSRARTDEVVEVLVGPRDVETASQRAIEVDDALGEGLDEDALEHDLVLTAARRLAADLRIVLARLAQDAGRRNRVITDASERDR